MLLFPPPPSLFILPHCTSPSHFSTSPYIHSSSSPGCLYWILLCIWCPQTFFFMPKNNWENKPVEEHKFAYKGKNILSWDSSAVCQYLTNEHHYFLTPLLYLQAFEGQAVWQKGWTSSGQISSTRKTQKYLQGQEICRWEVEVVKENPQHILSGEHWGTSTCSRRKDCSKFPELINPKSFHWCNFSPLSLLPFLPIHVTRIWQNCN